MARKTFNRVCVLVGRQEYEEHIGECRSRIHGHMSFEKARELEADGRCSWVYEYWTDSKGKEHKRALPAIKLSHRKRWKGKISGYPPMRVMQLVDA